METGFATDFRYNYFPQWSTVYVTQNRRQVNLKQFCFTQNANAELHFKFKYMDLLLIPPWYFVYYNNTLYVNFNKL